MKTTEGGGFTKGEERHQHVEEAAVTRLRSVSKAKGRCLGKQGPTPRKGQLGPEQNQRIAFLCPSRLGPMCSPLCSPSRPQSRGSK